MEKIKTRVTFYGSPQYFVNEKKQTVACRLTGYLHGGFLGPIVEIDKTAVAKCHPEDKFDIELGKRIAHAKAENIVYRYAASKCREYLNELNNEISSLNNFIVRAENCNLHNIDYIARISSEKE